MFMTSVTFQEWLQGLLKRFTKYMYNTMAVLAL